MSKADNFQPMSHSEKRLMFVMHGIQNLELALAEVYVDPHVSEAVKSNIAGRIELLHSLHQTQDAQGSE